MASSGMLRRVAFVIIDVSEELSASFIRVTRIGELGRTLAVTGNRRMLRRNTKYLTRILISRHISNSKYDIKNRPIICLTLHYNRLESEFKLNQI
jgi:hypothetical protein